MPQIRTFCLSLFMICVFMVSAASAAQNDSQILNGSWYLDLPATQELLRKRNAPKEEFTTLKENGAQLVLTYDLKAMTFRAVNKDGVLHEGTLTHVRWEKDGVLHLEGDAVDDTITFQGPNRIVINNINLVFTRKK